MKTLAPVLLVLAACRVMTSSELRTREVTMLAERGTGPENRNGDLDSALIASGDDAVPPLVDILRTSPDSAARASAARVLGRIYRSCGNPVALAAYVEVLKEGSSAALVRDLLKEAHSFDDPEGTVRLLLLAFIEGMPTATPEMIANAATLAGDDALGAMKAYVFRTRQLKDDRGRDLAIRSIGRAARHGRRDAVEFLVNCTTLDTEMLALTAERELNLSCGVNASINWRGWWLENARKSRFEWLVASAWRGTGRIFNPASEADWSALIAAADPAAELEPLFTMVAEGLGLRFGYLSTRDAFDPTVSEAAIAERGAAALDELRAWWRENRLYVAPDPATGGLAFDRARRDFELPTDWRGESDALAEHGDYAGAVMKVAALAGAEGLPGHLRKEIDAQRGKIIAAGRGYFHDQQARLVVVRETQPELAKRLCEEMISRLGNGKVTEFDDEVRKVREDLDRTDKN